MAPGLRKAALTVHVAASVGWLGAVVAYLPLAAAVLTSENTQVVRGAYVAMDLIVWYAILPLSATSLLTGLVSSLGTAWGLLRHYWVLFKLVLNLFATTVLLGYTQAIDSYAAVAAKTSLSTADLAALRDPTHVIHSGVGLLVLLCAAVLAIYKPRGLTPYGQRKRRPALAP